jgi:tetratricopeptide (TPR) repeat protein
MKAKRVLTISFLAVLLGGVALAAGLALAISRPDSALARHLDNRVASLRRWWNPPAQVVFEPQQSGVQHAAQATVQAMQTAAAPTDAPPAPAAALPPAAPPGAPPAAPTALPPTASPTPTLPPLPPAVSLAGIVHQYQLFNNCGPANLAMALSFWGWPGDQRDTRAFLRPNLDVDDKNVMPEEMVDFVEQFTALKALTRVGGDAALLKRLLAAGFPVIIEAGHDPADDWWMGHYLVVSGYDDAAQRWTAQDSLTSPDLQMPYADLDAWRDFNYVYVLLYPPERAAEVQAILGERIEPLESYRMAEERALEEIAALPGREQFFAWFNLGSSRVGLANFGAGDYAAAAEAYDQAFALYRSLPEDLRPYRLMWYQTGPYQAYYHAGRYQDVVALANTTFTWVGKGVLEESYYWRGMAYSALGVSNQALSDLKKAAALNPNYAPPRLALQAMGVTP